MTPILNFLSIFLFPIFLGMSSLAVPVSNTGINTVAHGSQDVSPRSTNTCADPSLTRPVLQGFNGQDIGHALSFREIYVNADTRGGPFFTLQGPAFKAWPSQQVSTVPLFNMFNSATRETVYLLGADAQTPPIVGGFTATAIIGWVYNTAMCGSVPLMSASFAAQTDHFYTTDSQEHAGILAAGWTDGGVVAFVIPLAAL